MAPATGIATKLKADAQQSFLSSGTKISLSSYGLIPIPRSQTLPFKRGTKKQIHSGVKFELHQTWLDDVAGGTIFASRKLLILSDKCSAVAEMCDRLATIDMAENCALCPFWPFGGPGSPSNTVWPGPRPTFVPSGFLIHPTGWPQ